MYERRSKFLGALVVALVTTACGPSDTANGTKGKTNPVSDQAAKAAQSDQGATSIPALAPTTKQWGRG